jgi:hypothetical protein
MILTLWMLLRQGWGMRSDHDEFPRARVAIGWTVPYLDLKTVML